jgi:transposase-like protein
MNQLSQPQFHDANVAREHLEAMRWPDGAICPHCDSKDVYTLAAKAGSKKPVRKGVYKCAECREQFTATIGTIFEDSKVPLNKWLLALHLLCASKKGMSAHQLHRMLGVAYKTAWFMSPGAPGSRPDLALTWATIFRRCAAHVTLPLAQPFPLWSFVILRALCGSIIWRP